MNINHSFSNRREARIIAFQSLFSYDFNPTSLEDIASFCWLNDESDNEQRRKEIRIIDYASFLIRGTIQNLEIIDETIKNRLKNWDFDRISFIDRAVLRFAIFSLLFEKDLDNKIVINEAIEIVKLFGTEDSYKFINGLLDRVLENDGNSNNNSDSNDNNNKIKKKKIIKRIKKH